MSVLWDAGLWVEGLWDDSAVPTLSVPTVTDITTTSARPQVTITNAAAGTLHFAVYPSAASAPTFDGTMWSGSPVATGSEASNTVDGVQTFADPATGLDPATDYKIAFVWDDGVDQSAVAWSDLWTTDGEVEKDADLRWALLQGATKDVDIRWALTQAIEKDADLRWALTQAIEKDANLRYNLLSVLHKDADLRWSLTHAIDKDASLLFNLLQAIEKGAGLLFNLLQAIEKDADLRYSVLGLVLVNATLQWTLQQSLGTKARPSETITPGAWTPSVAEAALHTMINTAAPELATWIQTTSATSGRFRLSTVSLPALAGRGASYYAGGTNGGLRVRLYQGVTLVSERVHETLPTTPTLYTLALNESELLLVTDGADLFVELEATA